MRTIGRLGTHDSSVRPSSGALVVVTGTGTSIGKTHFSEALIHAWKPRARVVGLKPIESGVTGSMGADASQLAAASSFHVKPCLYALRAPLSPHLAAQDENVQIREETIVEFVAAARRLAGGVVLELPGGLFSPVSDRMLNVELAKLLSPTVVLLVAPDRLGVLHDVIATLRAASAAAFAIDGVILVTPEHVDPSTGRNAAELSRIGNAPVVGVVPRASPLELSGRPMFVRLIDEIMSLSGLGLDDAGNGET